MDIKPEFLDAVEVWNEPNLIREWRGATLNGGTYMPDIQCCVYRDPERAKIVARR